jgi:hypothetical protein
VSINGLQFSAGNPRVTLTDGQTPRLSIDFRLLNTTETLKLDLVKELGFTLTDEFSNKYSYLAMMDNVPGAPSVPTSIYPKEALSKKLDFELPVEKATKVTLHVDANSLGISQPILISMSLPKNELNVGVKVTAPESGSVFERGAQIHLVVVPTSAVAPDKIIIDALDHTFEDISPKNNNIYDLNIPAEFTIGLTSVNVIAQWILPSGEKATASDTIMLYIKEHSPLGRL